MILKSILMELGHTTKLKNFFKRGNGSVIFGAGIMLFVLFVVYAFAQSFIFRVEAADAQLMADSIADATAVYMLEEGSSYDDAIARANELADLYSQTTGETYESVQIEEESFEEDTIRAMVTTRGSFLNYTRVASTHFERMTGGPIVSIAMAQLGKPYHWGAAGPNSFDCSGLVYYCYNQAGIPIPRESTRGLFAMCDISQDINSAQPGDLVFLKNTGGRTGISHVGIYIGNGQMIHAPRTGDVVKIVNVNTSSSHYAGIGKLRI